MTKFVTADRPYTSQRLLRRSVLSFVGLAAVSAGLAALYFSMRVIMEIGGSCASGNTPYAIARPCPTGVPGLMVGSIFLGLIGLGIYAVNAFGVNLTLLAWPALFLSLGWNFLEFGVNPPGGGTSGGWLVCGVIFALMGGLPLIFGVRAALQGRETRISKLDQDRLRERFRLTGHGAPGSPDASGSGGGSAGSDESYARTVRRYAILLQVAAIAVGIFVGIQLYESATGASVSIGFR
jgi:hypothetical protein